MASRHKDSSKGWVGRWWGLEEGGLGSLRQTWPHISTTFLVLQTATLIIIQLCQPPGQTVAQILWITRFEGQKQKQKQQRQKKEHQRLPNEHSLRLPSHQKKEKINHLATTFEPKCPNRLHLFALGVRLASQFPIQVDAGGGSRGGLASPSGLQMATLG